MKKTAEGKYLSDDLSNYDKDAYEKPSVTVDVAVCTFILSKVNVLLIKREFAPFRGYWAIPGGFVSIEKKESLEDAAFKKLKEETGLKDVFIEQLKTYGEPDRDPRMRVITVAYYSLVPYSKIAANLRDVIESSTAQWFSLHDLPKRIAFDHRLILNDLLSRLHGKISYTPIGFNLLDSQFTWYELQEVYENILSKKLLTPNFRRKILSMYVIKELEDKKKTRGRPSSLLAYKGEKEF